MAFDKCTLLSSQGTDAPTETISRPTREAIHYLFDHSNLKVLTVGPIKDQRRETRSKTRTKTLHRNDEVLENPPLETKRGLPASPLSPVGRTGKTLRREFGSVESRPPPGRVAAPGPEDDTLLRRSPADEQSTGLRPRSSARRATLRRSRSPRSGLPAAATAHRATGAPTR